MRRAAAILLTGAVCLSLTACGQNIPVKTADGAQWDDSWVNVGGIIGVDTPEGLDSREYNDTLGVNGMYYATWSSGEAEPYTNAEGQEAEIYDAQVYLLLSGYDEAGKAEDAAAEWLDMAAGQYNVEDTETASYNGQEYTVIAYTFSSDTNPYQRGASAFGVYRNYAVSVELSCQEDFDGDAREILAGFLENCHYAA